jgi:hypothetical protein
LFFELRFVRRLEWELETEDSRLPQSGGEKSTAEFPLLAGPSGGDGVDLSVAFFGGLGKAVGSHPG